MELPGGGLALSSLCRSQDDRKGPAVPKMFYEFNSLLELSPLRFEEQQK